MSWLALITVGILEIFGVIAVKKFVLSGKKKFILFIVALFMISFSFLGIAMEEISMGTAYAI